MRLCLIAYKIDPVLGSEDASGYHLVKEISRTYPNVTLISRRNNIERLRHDPDFQNIRLIGIDVPKIFSFYKKKGRGIILYYYLWQIFVARKVRLLNLQNPFDLVHQLNFHADWAPHFLNDMKARIIWGPIAHHPVTPYQWLPKGHKRAYLTEMLILAVKKFFWHLNPALKTAIKASHAILFANGNVPKPYCKDPAKLHLHYYAGSHWPLFQRQHTETDQFKLIFVGRMIALKGPHLALDAFEYFLQKTSFKTMPQFTLIGSGVLDPVITKKIMALKDIYGDVVTHHAWMEREKLQSYYQQADFMLYPSLESQGLVVSEAISQNCPVITLAGTGPAFITQDPELTINGNIADYKAMVAALGDKLIDLFTLKQANNVACKAIFDKSWIRAQDLQWSVIAKNIMKTYTA